tara:strand:+ start:66 stop:545 length:480 start_codon:yes stop_codon:yes gene_type:complete
MKYKVYFQIILLITLFFGCKKPKETLPKNKQVKGYFEATFDTIEFNKKQKLSFKFMSDMGFSKYEYNDNSFKLLDGCLILTSKDKLENSKENFDSMCDSIFSVSTKIKDTFNLDFKLKPTKKGENFYLIKFMEIIYLRTNDSIREINNTFFFDGKYYVE